MPSKKVLVFSQATKQLGKRNVNVKYRFPNFNYTEDWTSRNKSSGPYLRSAWASGLSAVPLGYSCYSPNAIESAHRSLKRLLSGKLQHRNVGQLLQQAGDAIASKANSGFYSGLQDAISEIPKHLLRNPAKQNQRLMSVEPQEDTKSKQVKRLDRHTILGHYKEAGPTGTFLASTCEHMVEPAGLCKLVYIMPKYKLNLCEERPADLISALKLSLATTVQEVELACQNPTTGCYDIWRHMYLRQTFTAVFVSGGRGVFDQHRDFVLGGGYSEHSLFIWGLVDAEKSMSKLPRGPQHSQPKKPKQKACVKLLDWQPCLCPIRWNRFSSILMYPSCFVEGFFYGFMPD